MATQAIVVRGGARLRRTLRKAGVDVAVLKKANLAAAATVASAGTVSAPRGTTGQLAASVRSGGSARAGVVRAGYKRVPYAGVIHWGWPQHSIRAQPWLSDAAQRTEPAWMQQYWADLNDILNSIEGIA